MDHQEEMIGLIGSIRELQAQAVMGSERGYDVSGTLEELDTLLEEVAGTCPRCDVGLELHLLDEFRGEKIIAWHCPDCTFHEIE